MVGLTPFLLALPIVGATMSCEPFVAKGWKHSYGRINFFDNDPTGPNGFHAPTLPGNATAAQPFRLSKPPNLGTSFFFHTCNSTTANLYATESESCSHGGCYREYDNYVQVIHEKTQNCLTLQTPGANTTQLRFSECIGDAGARTQLWAVSQQVEYSPSFGSITGYTPVSFDPVQPSLDEGPFLAWALDRKDNMTIELIHFPYTQAGLSAYVVKP